MNVMRAFTLRSLKRNKKRTIVTIIGVTISVAMITATAVLMASFVSFFQRSTIADSGNWHAILKDMPAQNVQALAQDSSVDSVTISRTIGFSAIPDSAEFSKQYLYLREYSAQGFNQMSIRLTDGRLPEKPGEVLISESILEGSKLDYAVGDNLTLTTGEIILPDNAPVTNNDYLSDVYDEDGNLVGSPEFVPKGTAALTVVGVMSSPNFESGWSAGYGVLGFLDESSLSPDSRVDVYITVKHLSRRIYTDVDTLVAQYGDGRTYSDINDDLLRYYGVVEWDNVYSFMQGFMLLIILIIVVASVSLIYNAFAMSVSERSRQLGLLASVGATRRQKRASVYFEGFFVGAFGIPLGIGAGIGGIAATLAAIQPLVESFTSLDVGVKMSLVVPLWAIGIAILFSVLTICISVYRPARRASKISPIDAIRQTHETRLTRRAVKTNRLTRRIFGFEAEIALKNLKRSRKRYRATVVSLVISLVLFLTVSSYADMTGSMSNAVMDGYNFDIAMRYSRLSDAQIEQLNEKISALEPVKSFAYNTTLYGHAQLKKSDLSEYSWERTVQYEGMPEDEGVLDISLVGIDNESFAAFAAAAGVNPADYADNEQPKAILINYGTDYDYVEGNNIKKSAGELLNLKAGDYLPFAAGDYGNNDKASLSIMIGAATDQRPMGVMSGSLSAATLVMPQSMWQAAVSRFTDEQLRELEHNSMILRSAYMSADEDQRLMAQINELVQNLPLTGYDIYNMKDVARSQNNVSIFLGVFVYGFIALISLICIANIINTVSTNIGLRRRELAMLRSVGMTPQGLNRMLRFESIFYGLKGLLWGLPISILIALLLSRMESNVFGMGFSLPWVSYIVAICAILVIVLASMAYSTHRIKRENIIDELKQETY